MASSSSEGGLGRQLGNVLESFVPGLATMEEPLLPQHRNNTNGNTDDVVLDLGNEEDNEEETNQSNAAPNRQSSEEGQGGPGLTDMRLIRTLNDKLLAFLLILAGKILYDHSLGLLVFIGLFGTFTHHNSALKRQISLKEKKRAATLILMMFMLPFSAFFVYFVFSDQELYKCFIFLRPAVDSFGLWSVLWCAGITDFAIKFFTICCKCAVASMPGKLLEYKRRGRVFLTIEQVSQLYRLLPPVPLWLFYFTEDSDAHWIVGYIFAGLYIISKVSVLYSKLQDVKLATSQLCLEVQYGTAASNDQVTNVGNSCPICQDDFCKPIQLHCKHIFCEDCVALWFDRERTCPMCRAKVADDPVWRDGATSLFVQFF